jgi:Z1 domain
VTVTSDDIFNSAYGVASSFLQLEKPITLDALERTVALVGAMPQFAEVNLGQLRKALEARNNIRVGGYSLIDDKDFQSWIQGAREKRPFEFWERYKNYLDLKKRFPEDVVRQLDNLTDDILDRLRDPSTAGNWDRRGLVVGDVQSGKTSNYTGLICKAVDAGFPLIIVLAGVHNSLRSQTQIRLDEGFLGFDTRLNLRGDQENLKIGAGALPGQKLLIAHSLTSSSDSGDFKRGTADGTKLVPGGKDPIILVVKKSVSILDNLLKWVASVRGVNDDTIPGGKIIRDVPVLVIDDEADYASANTKEYRDDQGEIDPDADPTKTNLLIRKLLTTFEKSAYVGYTATPFANVFMHHEATNKDVGDDLFPRSFIINIPAPSNYIGAEKVFGLERPGEKQEAKGLPIIRRIDDASQIFPLRHDKWLKVDVLPPSLHEAILSFILACAARRVRGDKDADNSMLIHVTRFTMVQEQIAELVREALIDVRRQLEFPGTGGNSNVKLRELWDIEFAPKFDAIASSLPEEDLEPVTWKDVQSELYGAVKRIAVREINGSAKDALDYAEHPQGLSVIAIGGDKLSRGLTLEGLTVSYFVRTSKMYDTLMQMGRWFGYRPRYADLCRLYTSPELVKWYRHIATATAELREEFDLVFDSGGNPLEFGHRVRTHPDGLMITAANKMRSSTKIRAGFAGTISETVSFDIGSAEHNLEQFAQFFENLPRIPLDAGRYIWNDVEGKKIQELMNKIETSRDSWKANSKALSRYINERVTNGRLGKWTVVLLAGGTSKRRGKIGPYELPLNKRENRSEGDTERFTIGRLVSPPDEMSDFTLKQKENAMAETLAAWRRKSGPKREAPKSPSGPFIRKQRSKDRGLLLVYPLDPGPPETDLPPIIGFGVSLPFDSDAPLIDYAANSVKQLEELFA